ncbi:MAG: 5'-3' exonuclease [Pseudomonadota bacterium]
MARPLNPVAAVPLPADPVLLVDASSYLFRAWFGVPDAFFDRRGRPLNAVVGFARTLGTLLAAARPAAVAVAFDESLFSGFRHRLDPGYKANRSLPDRDLAWQMKACRELVAGLGLATVASGEYEADDLLATLAVRAGRAGQTALVVSEDKDLVQLLAGPQARLWQYARQRVLDRESAADWLGIDPVRLPELQALTGDAADNIPGVPGFGPVAARTVLAGCSHLEELLADPSRVSGLPVRGAARLAAALAASRARVRLNLRLTGLSRRATGLPRQVAMRYRPPSPDTVAAVLDGIGLPAGSARAFADTGRNGTC